MEALNGSVSMDGLEENRRLNEEGYYDLHTNDEDDDSFEQALYRANNIHYSDSICSSISSLHSLSQYQFNSANKTNNNEEFNTTDQDTFIPKMHIPLFKYHQYTRSNQFLSAYNSLVNLNIPYAAISPHHDKATVKGNVYMASTLPRHSARRLPSLAADSPASSELVSRKQPLLATFPKEERFSQSLPLTTAASTVSYTNLDIATGKGKFSMTDRFKSNSRSTLTPGPGTYEVPILTICVYKKRRKLILICGVGA
jgi:hypothetical protein